MQTVYARCHTDYIKCYAKLQLNRHFLKATILRLIFLKGASLLCAFASPLSSAIPLPLQHVSSLGLTVR